MRTDSTLLDLRTKFRDPLLRLAYRTRQQEGGTCWEWSGGRHPTGYGAASGSGRGNLAHRLAYETHVGPIPKGFVVMHTCDNPPCVNPRHLLAAPMAVNVLDRDLKGRTFRKHPLGYKPPSGYVPRPPFGCAKKLTAAAVLEVRERYVRGRITLAELAAEYGVTGQALGQAIRGVTWRAARWSETDVAEWQDAESRDGAREVGGGW